MEKPSQMHSTGKSPHSHEAPPAACESALVLVRFRSIRSRPLVIYTEPPDSHLEKRLKAFIFLVCLALFTSTLTFAQVDNSTRQLAHDIFKQLIEINTTDSVGNVTTAAEAMAQRLRDAGFSDSDIQVIGPNDRKKNMVARLHGTGKHKPVLLIGHLDVVEAKRSDWTTDPFQFVEKDGYFYGRGTQDMKGADAVLVTTMIRFKKEGYRPDRDIILALTADEEGGSSNGVSQRRKNGFSLIRPVNLVEACLRILPRRTSAPRREGALLPGSARARRHPAGVGQFASRWFTEVQPVKNLAGAGGFEPPYGGIKIRCLTTWLRPSSRRSASR